MAKKRKRKLQSWEDILAVTTGYLLDSWILQVNLLSWILEALIEKGEKRKGGPTRSDRQGGPGATPNTGLVNIPISQVDSGAGLDYIATTHTSPIAVLS